MAQDERTIQGRGPERPAASPPGYGGLSEGTVGDPSAAGQKGAPAEPTKGAPAEPAATPEGREGAAGAREQAAHGQDVEEGDASPGVDTPRGGGSSNEAIPGVFDGSKPLTPESSAEHKSSWPDEGATGEAGAG
ncbi:MULTISPECIES: hypothetical protein [Sorangium]|uniref:Uncharacterized protein n=1 Tax=Sorangium cellulosum TaxID=56 RepID=A0A4V0NFJ6_SORCE|nr:MULTISPECIES: hypothetical protein [Sorangium]AUX29902.1 uncharacterized protein SOCE836_019950 [Sorangium cellulosum]WCQ89290.1 hypothetical protein NQZ70_01977 [Sorangium sp. Soce836]